MREDYPMSIENATVQGRNGRILGSFFRAAGSGRHPLVLLCHGIPGSDPFLDLAYFLQRRGIHVMTFHYSGSWGSEGNYSVENCLADTDAEVSALLLRQDPTIDAEHFFIVGHSLGGFCALHTFARRRELRAGVFLSPADLENLYRCGLREGEENSFAREIAGDCEPLQGQDGTGLQAELAAAGGRYLLPPLAGKLSGRPMLFVGGSRDEVTPMALCQEPLLGRLQGEPVERVVYDAPHDYLNVREQVLARVYEFLQRQC